MLKKPMRWCIPTSPYPPYDLLLSHKPITKWELVSNNNLYAPDEEMKSGKSPASLCTPSSPLYRPLIISISCKTKPVSCNKVYNYLVAPESTSLTHKIRKSTSMKKTICLYWVSKWNNYYPPRLYTKKKKYDCGDMHYNTNVDVILEYFWHQNDWSPPTKNPHPHLRVKVVVMNRLFIIIKYTGVLCLIIVNILS